MYHMPDNARGSSPTSNDQRKSFPIRSTDSLEPDHPTFLTTIIDFDGDTTCFEKFAVIGSLLIAILTFPFSLFICFKVAFEYERVVIFRLGKLRRGARGPGLYFVLPCIDDYHQLDLRTETFDVYPQDILTKDNVSIRLDAVVFFRVYNPTLGVVRIGNYKYATMLLAQTTLRNVAGTKTLGELLTSREEISFTLQQILDKGTEPWGIKVERVEVKDVRLPEAMHRSMAAEAEANREASAKIVAAEGEKQAASALKEASEIICMNPATIQLRYLQTLHTISIDNSSTIVVPIPQEMIKMCSAWDSNIRCHCSAQNFL